jgi:hypothetical protein
MSNAQGPQPQAPIPVEEQKRMFDARIRAAERAHDDARDWEHKQNEAVLRNADAAIKTFILVNGGAAVSVLAFVGGLASKTNVSLAQLHALAGSLIWFASGVASAAVGAVFAYLTNYAYGEASTYRTREWEYPFLKDTPASVGWRKAGVCFHIVGVVATLFSLGFFMWGMFCVRHAIWHLG